MASKALTFCCGHPRTPDNTASHGPRGRCRKCQREQRRAYRDSADPETRRIEYRQRYLPIALEHTREKLRELEREARALGMIELLDEPCRLTGNQILDNPALVDRAWDREAEIARIQARL